MGDHRLPRRLRGILEPQRTIPLDDLKLGSLLTRGGTILGTANWGKFGQMVAFQGSGVSSVRISEAVGRLKTVPIDGSFVRTARALGICLGD